MTGYKDKAPKVLHQTGRQARAAYRRQLAQGPRLSRDELRRFGRQEELEKRAKAIRDREARAKSNKRKRLEREQKEKEAKRLQVAEGKLPPEALLVKSSQPRLNSFFSLPKIIESPKGFKGQGDPSVSGREENCSESKDEAGDRVSPTFQIAETETEVLLNPTEAKCDWQSVSQALALISTQDLEDEEFGTGIDNAKQESYLRNNKTLVKTQSAEEFPHPACVYPGKRGVVYVIQKPSFIQKITCNEVSIDPDLHHLQEDEFPTNVDDAILLALTTPSPKQRKLSPGKSISTSSIMSEFDAATQGDDFDQGGVDDVDLVTFADAIESDQASKKHSQKPDKVKRHRVIP